MSLKEVAPLAQAGAHLFAGHELKPGAKIDCGHDATFDPINRGGRIEVGDDLDECCIEKMIADPEQPVSLVQFEADGRAYTSITFPQERFDFDPPKCSQGGWLREDPESLRGDHVEYRKWADETTVTGPDAETREEVQEHWDVWQHTRDHENEILIRRERQLQAWEAKQAAEDAIYPCPANWE
jgi:hypothetical protein